MKSRVIIEWSIIVLTVAGCATSPPSVNEPLSISSNDLWTEPHKYDRKYVVVTGLLHQRNYLYFEDVVTTNNLNPVIHIRLEYPDMGKLDAEVAPADCENQFVQVYGFFRQWDQYELIFTVCR